MAPAPSRSLRSTQLASDLIDLSSDEESSASEIEAGSNTDDEYATAYDTTDYDDSDVEVLLDAIRRITMVETGPNTYAVAAPDEPSATDLASHQQPVQAPSPSLPTPVLPPGLAAPDLNTAGKIYAVQTSSVAPIVMVDHWAKAGDLTQGHPDALVHAVKVRTDAWRGGRYKAYRVTVGYRPGVYILWRDGKRVTSGCPGQIVNGHATILDAHIRFADDVNKGLVRQVPYTGHQVLPFPVPTPQGLPPPPESTTTTYVVTQGRRVGVFSDWAEAAAQVAFVSCANTVSYPTRAAAEAAFALAQAEGHVRVRWS